MKHIFKVGEEVFAKVNGLQPFPAVVENVLLTESDCSVFYYVRFRGASEIVPLDAESLLSYEDNKNRFKLKYSEKELKRESKQRVDGLLGAEDEIPEVLLNFVTVDSDFEVVSEEAVKNLGLCSIILTPRMVEDIDKGISSRNGHADQESEEEDFVDVEDIQPDDKPWSLRKKNAKSGFPCPTCYRKFKTRMALKAHQRQNSVCRLSAGQRQNVAASKPQSDLKKSTHKLEAQISDASRKANDVVAVDKSKWASRSASGYYPCKLCFRKFRSIGEAQLHMSMHKSQLCSLKGSELAPSEGSNARESEDSVSVGDDDESRSMHNCLERNRRAELASRFADLAEVTGTGKGAAKVKILDLAKSTIEELEKDAEDLDRVLGYLTEMNVKLRAQYLALDPDER